MTHEQARRTAFALLATAIPPLGARFRSVEATVEVLCAVYAAASKLSSEQLVDAQLEAAAVAATHKLAGLIAKKGGMLPDSPPLELPAALTMSPAMRAACFGYQAVWETIGAVTAGRKLPALVAEIVATKAADPASALYAAATGQAAPGRQIPRSAPLEASAFVATLLAELPERPRGVLRIVNGIAIWGTHDEGTLAQIQRCADDERVVGAAIAADGHRGYAIPIGGIIVYEQAVSPNGVGFDIGCGIKAVKTDLRADALLQLGADGRTLLATVMDDIQRTVAFGMGRTSGQAIDHQLFDDPTWRTVKEVGRLRDMAAKQLGTVGGGNHFVDLSRDADGWLWIVCHFGSRGLGHKTATGFLNLAAGRRWDDKAPGENSDAPAVVLPLDTELGQQYMAAMELGGTYAYAGRDFVAEQVRTILGAGVLDSVHNHHNYAFRERHGDKDLIVVRKGATPAGPGVRGIIAGSMGTPTAIVRGVASPEAAVSFHSAPHGSGRVMSRTQAAGKRDYRTGRILSPGRVTPEMLHSAVTARGIELRGGGLDESPHVYRNIADVLAAHEGVIEVETLLYPMGVAMAGDSVIDPFKD